MATQNLHNSLCERESKIRAWYEEKTSRLAVPIYSSYDIRDAGFKVSNVDANIFPAGFNNICVADKEHAQDVLSRYLKAHYRSDLKRVLLVTEEHTNNPYYWENVATLVGLFKSAGIEARVGFPKKLTESFDMTSASGQVIQVHSGFLSDLKQQGFIPDLIVSNNDFSDAHEDWAHEHRLFPMNPPRELGWYQRKKSRYFAHYNHLVSEFADLVGFDPFLLNVRTESFSDFDLSQKDSREELAHRVDAMIADLKKDYDKRNISSQPFVFVKNNSGTYGLAVMRVGSGDEVKDWNNRSRTKMKAAKGGRDVEELIIQEGIPSTVHADGAVAEPVIYMIGCELAGGFLRSHSEKSETESLNSPGAVYKRLCMSDLNVSLQGSPLENVYGCSAKLGLLAIAMEAQEMNVPFLEYKATPCGL